MKVKATRKGYYEHELREEGDVFDINATEITDVKTGKRITVPVEQVFSEKWMAKVEGDTETEAAVDEKPAEKKHGKRHEHGGHRSHSSEDVI